MWVLSLPASCWATPCASCVMRHPPSHLSQLPPSSPTEAPRIRRLRGHLISVKSTNFVDFAVSAVEYPRLCRLHRLRGLVRPDIPGYAQVKTNFTSSTQGILRAAQSTTRTERGQTDRVWERL
ncbi:hypothetical protein JG688_00013693 [Phytophthora aleatoria]|uniref:Uncharacterized protein n=1 Tax=Phytophthora aleatoria TaxID=2496075 RepID=A0A8J5IYF3_9STRA|nr:hypothetical protein JG688_00013693 [Phytophthora aleatoria]